MGWGGVRRRGARRRGVGRPGVGRALGVHVWSAVEIAAALLNLPRLIISPPQLITRLPVNNSSSRGVAGKT